MFLKGFEIVETGIFIDESVLVKLLSSGISDQASCGDEFNIDLTALAGIGHLFIGLGNILWVRQLHSHLAPFAQESVKARDGSGIPSLPQLDPEYYEPCVRVPAAYIINELDLFRPVLIWVMVRTV